MTREESAKVIAALIAAYPQQASRLDRGRVAAMIDVWASLLADLPYDRVDASLRALLASQTFMPSVAEVRAMDLELRRGPVRAGGEAWGSALKAMKCEGAYKLPGVDFDFADPLVTRCVNLLGWTELCLSEHTVADRARFIELYDRLALQRRGEEQVPLLSAAREARATLAAGGVARVMAQLAERTEKP